MRCQAGRGQAGNAGGLDAVIAEEVAAEAARLIGGGVLDDSQAIETEARRAALRIMGHAVERRFNADHSDDQGPWLSCECGGQRASQAAGPRLSRPLSVF